MNESMIQKQGTMFIFSGPSGSGKSSVIKKILAQLDNISLSVSATTRPMREGEVDGKDYHFISTDEFKKLVKDNALYEYVDSDFGPKYGTPRKNIDELLIKGEDVILDLDYPGVQQILELAGDRVKTISLIPPSISVLYNRLVGRGTDSAEVIAKRMSMAEKRIKECVFYDYVVVNDDLDVAVEEVKAIIVAARAEKKNLCGLESFVQSVIEG